LFFAKIQILHLAVFARKSHFVERNGGMKVRSNLYLAFCFAVFVLLSQCATLSVSQTAAAPATSGALRGQVTDPSGAAIAKATVIMTPAATSSTPIKTQSDGQGNYEFKALAPSQYSLTVVADGFSLYENDNVNIAAGQALRLNVPMNIQVEEQKINVSDSVPTVDVNPANNAGAIIISGKELDALPDDPDELLTDLQALAGPSAGPNGGQLYIDGFTAGQLPPKSSIREIRINSNPFSAEYDKLGYGRIEAWHRQLPRPDSSQRKRFGVQYDRSICRRRAKLLHCPVRWECWGPGQMDKELFFFRQRPAAKY